MRSTGHGIHNRPGLGGGAGIHILVIEDGSDPVVEISNQLARQGYRLTQVASPEEALSLACTSPPEVAVLPPAVAADPAASALSRLLHERFAVALVCLLPSLEESALERARNLEPYGYVLLPTELQPLRAAIEVAVLIRDVAVGLRGPAASSLVQRLSMRLGAEAFERQREARHREQLIAQIAHELRTPLASIIGFADSFLLGLHGALDPLQSRHMGTIQRAGEHLLSLVDDLIELSRLGSADLQLLNLPVSCAEVVREVTEILAPLAARKPLALQAPVPDENLFVLADRRALAQILFNLIGNALKFTQQGSVSVTCRRGEAAISESRVLIEVRDTGPGISDEARTKLLHGVEVGLQLRGHLGPRASGLGLRLSSRLAARMKGVIRAEGTPGVGSVFTVDLPAAAPSRG